MIIQHHPSDELLLAYSAGSLDQGQHVAIATHLLQCVA
jgi:putative transcriptional regulator